MSDHWLHRLFLKTLADLCVKDASNVLVNDVEALGAVQNLLDLLDCFFILDDPSSSVRLEDCHRCRACTRLH